MTNNDKTSQLFDRLLLSLSEYLDSQVYIPVKNEIGTETEHSLGIRKEMFKNFMESQVEKLKDDLKDDLKKVDIHQWIFRFASAAPAGRFEYTCRICGNYEILEIPKDLPIDVPIRYTCKCGAIIYIWQQSNHWHLKIIEKNQEN